MGATTVVLILADADVPTARWNATCLPDRELAEALVGQVRPGFAFGPVDNSDPQSDGTDDVLSARRRSRR
jgi:hypothetical protein